MTNVIQQNDTVKNNIFKMANKDREVIDILLNVLEDVKNEDFIDFLIKLDKKKSVWYANLERLYNYL